MWRFSYKHAAAGVQGSVLPLFVPRAAAADNVLSGLISPPIGEIGNAPRPNAFNRYGRVCTLSRRRRERLRAAPPAHRQCAGKDPG